MELDQVVAELKEKITEQSIQFSVLLMFCQTLIHTLSEDQQASVESSLRSGLNQVLDLSDDQPMHAGHQSAALTVANVLFAEFARLRRAQP